MCNLFSFIGRKTMKFKGIKTTRYSNICLTGVPVLFYTIKRNIDKIGNFIQKTPPVILPGGVKLVFIRPIPDNIYT